jgi:hypothetical protein
MFNFVETATTTTAVSPVVSVYGDMRVAMGIMYVVAQTSGSIETGLGTVYGCTVSPCSATTTTVPKIKLNIGTAGTAIGGMINFTPTISGDTYYLVAFGK